MFSGLRTSSIWLPFDEVLRPLNRSEEHTSELQSHSDLVCRLLLEKKKKIPALESDPRREWTRLRQLRKSAGLGELGCRRNAGECDCGSTSHASGARWTGEQEIDCR